MTITNDRRKFIKQTGRLAMIIILAAFTVILGRKVSAGRSCQGCPGSGKCLGETDCENY